MSSIFVVRPRPLTLSELLLVAITCIHFLIIVFMPMCYRHMRSLHLDHTGEYLELLIFLCRRLESSAIWLHSVISFYYMESYCLWLLLGWSHFSHHLAQCYGPTLQPLLFECFKNTRKLIASHVYNWKYYYRKTSNKAKDFHLQVIMKISEFFSSKFLSNFLQYCPNRE